MNTTTATHGADRPDVRAWRVPVFLVRLAIVVGLGAAGWLLGACLADAADAATGPHGPTAAEHDDGAPGARVRPEAEGSLVGLTSGVLGQAAQATEPLTGAALRTDRPAESGSGGAAHDLGRTVLDTGTGLVAGVAREAGATKPGGVVETVRTATGQVTGELSTVPVPVVGSVTEHLTPEPAPATAPVPADEPGTGNDVGAHLNADDHGSHGTRAAKPTASAVPGTPAATSASTGDDRPHRTDGAPTAPADTEHPVHAPAHDAQPGSGHGSGPVAPVSASGMPDAPRPARRSPFHHTALRDHLAPADLAAVPD
ncbi:hypothetical protein [Actinomadura flavalba]|uniref:hypothetical protein n=1 Tax=Actinomadura flavalba TaxID=1120938 RepID=UPI0003A1DCA1|nr:hypothetical protein [Actinomadura flavalba]